MATTTFKGIGNNIAATLSASISAVASSATLQSGEGAAMPSTPFWGTIFEDDPEVNEIVLVTNRSTDTLTITRGQQGTSANSWNADANFQILMTASNLTDIHTAVNNLETRLGNGTGDVTITTGDLDVARSGAALNVTWDSYYGGAANVSHDFRISRGTSGTPTIVQNADEVDLNFWGHDGSAWRQFATIAAYINGTPGLSDMPGGLAFKVSPDGGVTPALALKIAQNLVATFYGTVNMLSTISVTGAATFGSTLLASGDITAGNTGTSNRNVVIKANAGYFAILRIGGSSTDLRWICGKNGDAESGSNAGSAYYLAAYGDTGSFIDNVFSCVRAQYGAFSFNRPVVFNSNRRDTPKVITYASTITPNMRDGNYQQCTLTGNVTIAAPSNVAAGDMLEIVLVQDGTGSRTATWNSVYKFASGDTGTLTTTAGKKDVFIFRAYDATNLICTGIKKNI